MAAMGAGDLFTDALMHRKASDVAKGDWNFLMPGPAELLPWPTTRWHMYIAKTQLLFLKSKSYSNQQPGSKV